MLERLKRLLSAGQEPVIQVRQKVDYELMARYVSLHLNTKSVFVEVGSYNGGGAIEICQLSELKPSNCYLIEACPINFKVLKKTCPNFNTFHYAVAASDGMAKFYVVDDPLFEGTSSVSNGLHGSVLKQKFSTEQIKEVDVLTISLSSFYKKNQLKKVDFLKMNCEGGEYEIFKGDLTFLDCTRFIYLDLHGKAQEFSAEQKFRIWDILESKGFTRVGGHRKNDINNPDLGHVSVLWEKNARVLKTLAFPIDKRSKKSNLPGSVPVESLHS